MKSYKLFYRNGVLVAIGLIFSICSYSQSVRSQIDQAKRLPVIGNRMSITGYPNIHGSTASKDSLRKGFRVLLQDNSYKIVSFLISYAGDDCDIWERMIYGDSVSVKEVPLLRTMRKSGIFFFSAFKVAKGDRFYTVPDIHFTMVE